MSNLLKNLQKLVKDYKSVVDLKENPNSLTDYALNNCVCFIHELYEDSKIWKYDYPEISKTEILNGIQLYFYIGNKKIHMYFGEEFLSIDTFNYFDGKESITFFDCLNQKEQILKYFRK